MRKKLSLLLMVTTMASLVSFGVANATSSATPNFTDVPSSSPYYAAITWLSANGVIQGYGDGTYRPQDPVNRAEMLKMIFLADGNGKNAASALSTEQLFPDTPNGQWYAEYVALARQRGTVQGYPDGTFRPSNNINKAEAYKVVLKEFFNDTTLNFTVTHTGLPSSGAIAPDVSSSDWFAPYINFAALKNIYNAGTWGQSAHGVYFYPSQNLTRGELAQLIYRAKAIADNFPNDISDATSVYADSTIPFNVSLYNYTFAQASNSQNFSVTDPTHPNATFADLTMYPTSLLTANGDTANTLNFYEGANPTVVDITIQVLPNPNRLTVQQFMQQNLTANLYLKATSTETLLVNALPAVWFHGVTETSPSGLNSTDEVVALQFQNTITILTDHGSKHTQDGVFNYMVRNFWFKNVGV